MIVRSKPWKAAFLGGAIAGTLDMTYAFLAYGARGVSPGAILQSIASGLLGRDAYAGGAFTAALGLVLQFLIATLMAGGFVVLSRLAPLLLRRPLLTGAVYGLFLYVLMNYVVVPLSAAYPGTRPQGWMLAGALFAHVVLVGIPIAWIASRAKESK
jgi:uncharacterized membrane protein YagU involved in acid resistance